MPNHIYKSLELTGSSTKNIEDAVTNAIARASKTIHNLKWFQVREIRGHIENEAVDNGSFCFRGNAHFGPKKSGQRLVFNSETA